MKNYKNKLAHYDQSGDIKEQYLLEHLFEVSRLAAERGKEIGLENICALIGLLHDFGKYKHMFQLYLKGEYEGRVNHSSAGARILSHVVSVVESYKGKEKYWRLFYEIVCYPILSHHGLYDIIDHNYDCRTSIRLEVEEDEMKEDLDFFHYLNNEYTKRNGKSIYDLYDEAFEEFVKVQKKMYNMAKLNKKDFRKKTLFFYRGALIRLLLSILKEADIYNSSNYYRTSKDILYTVEDLESIWGEMSYSLDELYHKFEVSSSSNLDRIRNELSDILYKFSKENSNGNYEVNLPVGTGKTLANLRYSVGNCKEFGKSKMIYTTAFLSVLEQNSKVIKEALGDDYILEHHSNIIEDNERGNDEDDLKEYQVQEYLKESWESPVILTTLVQLSNTLFKDKSSNIRRFSKLINSVIIIDEIQSLPNKAVYNFNLMMNFLAEIMNCNIIHSTATPPSLDNKNALVYPCFYKGWIKNINTLDLSNSMEVFKRVEYYNLLGKDMNNEMGANDLINHVKHQLEDEDSALIILNTKQAVADVYNTLSEDSDIKDMGCEIIYLTTNQYAVHRLNIIEDMKDRLVKLRNKDCKRKLICVSTKLIEAGVDIDFDIVYRSLAGIDSAIQSGGRCNREGKKNSKGKVFIFKFKNENLKSLIEIRKQIAASKSALRDLVKNSEDHIKIDIEKACELYFNKLFSNEESEGNNLEFIIDKVDTILNLLSTNKNGRTNFKNKHGKGFKFELAYGFKSAAKNFDLIKEETQSVIVQHKNKDLIDALYKAIEDKNYYDIKIILKKLQPYTIGLRINDSTEHVITRELEGEICILLKDAYDDKVGLTKLDLQTLIA